MDTNEGMQPHDRVNPPAPAEDDAEQQPGSSSLFTYLVLGVALLLYLQYRGWELDNYWSATKAILGLGLVIFIHELGHFLVAKWCDVYVETFSIGFGPPLPGCHFQWGETTYMVALFPLGGYVKMLGEGTETDEADTDPRSFKNKTVLQRMAIICAGVIMNVVLALVCFVFVYMTRGAERMPGIIDTVDNGSAIWKKGVHRGDVIYRIGDKVAEPPRYFVWFDQDLQPTVMLSQRGEHLDFVYGPAGVPPEKMTQTTIEPRYEETDSKPVIGLKPPDQLKLPPSRFSRDRDLPVINDSAVARAEPPFKFGDTIIATSDPDQPSRVTELPIDPRDPEGKRHDYFEFGRRMERLAGEAVTMRVRRHRSADGDGDVASNRPAEEVDIKVPPSYRFAFGMRMGMAPITAVRDPAKEAGVAEGDIIESVEVVGKDGKTIRWVSTRSKDKKTDVVERDLDPERLPFELERWADQKPAVMDVTLQVRRTNSAEGGRELKRIETIRVPYNTGWRYDREVPLGSSSPLSLSGLGIAYRIKTTIEGVAADRAAAKAVLDSSTRLKYSKGDVFRIKPQQGDVVVRQGKTYKVEDGTLKEDEEFKLEEGDEVQRAGLDSVTLKDGVELRLDKGEVISLRSGDMIKEVRYYDRVNKRWSPPWSWFEQWSPRVVIVPLPWQKIGENQWAFLGSSIQRADIKKLGFRVKRNTDTVEVILQAEEDRDWPVEERGFLLMHDSRLEKADSFGKAIAMGMDTTQGFIKQIFGNLYSVGTGRLSPTNFGGPIMIGNYAFNIAGTNFYLFVQFLGIISVNLAVINFLPIPVLDGGHMVFLIYEGVRGKPASEQVRVAATWVGLAFIVSLMLFVIYLDVMRQI